MTRTTAAKGRFPTEDGRIGFADRATRASPRAPTGLGHPAGIDLRKDIAAFARSFAMPSADTFSVPPIAQFVRRYLAVSKASVDPFARNNRWATVTNDLNPATTAEYHLDAETFLRHLASDGRRFDLALFDPPYSPRQISECYKGVGIEVGMKETQNAALYRRVRDALAMVLTPDAIVLSFGWNSNGMGKGRGWEIIETLLVAHGGGHNDTICIAERRAPNLNGSLFEEAS